jgi:hypothetical protein
MPINNYIPVSRKLFEHHLWCEERVYSRFEAWLDLLQSTRFEDTKLLIGNRWIEVKRGQNLVSLRYLSGRWQWSTKKVNAFLELLIHDAMIKKETPKETGQTVITICNYEKYNPDYEKWKQQKKQEGNSKETARKQEGNKINKENNENIVKNGGEAPAPPPLIFSESEQIDSLLLENFHRFQKWISANAPNVAKMDEPFTIEQFKKLKEDFTAREITDELEKMHNWKWLLKNNKSANLTFRKWKQKDKK